MAAFGKRQNLVFVKSQSKKSTVNAGDAAAANQDVRSLKKIKSFMCTARVLYLQFGIFKLLSTNTDYVGNIIVDKLVKSRGFDGALLHVTFPDKARLWDINMSSSLSGRAAGRPLGPVRHYKAGEAGKISRGKTRSPAAPGRPWSTRSRVQGMRSDAGRSSWELQAESEMA